MSAILIMIFNILFFCFIVIALIYLIARRLDIKKNETFEDRDN